VFFATELFSTAEENSHRQKTPIASTKAIFFKQKKIASVDDFSYCRAPEPDAPLKAQVKQVPSPLKAQVKQVP